MATNAEDHPKANGTPNSLGHADLTDIIVPPTRSATEDTQCFKLNNGSVKNNDESATRRAASEFEPTSLRTLQGQPNAEVKKRATQAKNKGWKESIGMDIASNTLTAKAQKVRGRSNKQSMPTASPRHSLGSSTSQPNETQKRGQMSESITSSTHPTDCVVQTHGEKEATELMAESSDHSIVEQEAESIRNGQVKVVKLSSPKPDANGGVLVSQAPETNGVEFDLNIFGIDDLFSPTSVCSNVTLDNIVVKMPESIGDLEGPLLDPSTPSPSSTQKIDTVTTPTLTLEQDNSSKDIMMTPPPTNGKRSSLCDDTTPTQRKNKKVKVESSLTELERQIAERKRILEEKKAKTAAMKKLAAEAKV
ncbi:hypothetical protein M501DRAFT_993389 [Patellaria atrata CBS 101060]|uniref:Uncharacterized protein n=1 Tax=Patellaria atrata CBS 101060 TaxID=1346257 RepID=A0A9P4SGU3_9PEZI|nr:hypothetical protein M501DRAFT_993389 [Patellaria atrata CBS 101060]